MIQLALTARSTFTRAKSRTGAAGADQDHQAACAVFFS